eukprot:SAG31_NODE_4776_length_2961_cov_5.154437_2_plen_92_part_00
MLMYYVPEYRVPVPGSSLALSCQKANGNMMGVASYHCGSATRSATRLPKPKSVKMSCCRLGSVATSFMLAIDACKCVWCLGRKQLSLEISL